MSNLLSYGIYIPRFQIENQVLNPRLGKRTGKRTIIFSDEDSVTLAFAAANKCLENFSRSATSHQRKKTPHANIDAILFASTTPVFKNRYQASFLAELLDLPKGILAMDLTASPRSGTDALLLADHLIRSKQLNNILILAADAFFPPIGKELIPVSQDGHAGCALLLGYQEGIAAIRSSQSYSSFIAEEFTYKGNSIRLDSRFGSEYGFKSNIKYALNNFLDRGALKASNFNTVILNSLYAKYAVGLFKKKEFDVEKQFFIDSLKSQTGFTGVCHALMLFIDSLEKNCCNLLLIDYFNGANFFRIKQTEPVKRKINTIEEQLNDKAPIESYQDYLAVRKTGSIDTEASAQQEMFSSDMMLEREKENILHLKGFQCSSCGTIYFFKTHRCKKCQNETFTLRKLSKHGVIFSFTKEHYFPSSFSPVTMVVVDLEGGGRLTLQMTDEMYQSQSSKSLIGSKVELVLRKMMDNDCKPNYFWKCTLMLPICE